MCLVGHNSSGQLLPIHGKGYLNLIGLVQAILNHLIWQPAGSQRVHLLFHLNWGMDMDLMRSDIVVLVNHCWAIIMVT